MAEKRISDKVGYSDTNEKLSIDIIANVDKSKVNILLFWLVLWIIVGVSMIYYLFSQDIADDNMKITIYVFLGFWLYYLYKVMRAYRWLAYGREEIIVNDSTLTLTQWVGKRGLPFNYPIEDISKISKIDVDITSFQYQMNNSFWVIGGDRLQFTYNDSPVVFAKRLDDKELKKVMRLINDRRKANKKP